MLFRVFFAVFLIVSLASCYDFSSGSSSSSEDVEDESHESSPEDGHPSAMVETSQISADDECPAGGVEIHQGIDLSGNGILEEDEIYETKKVCHGESGNDGITSLIRTEEVDPGEHCYHGGMRVDVGLDHSGNGILEDDEITQTSYVCSISETQIDGYSSLLDLEDEPPGDNCGAGGQKISSGLDFSRNGRLEKDEITQVAYVCDGSSPVVHQVLVETRDEPNGENCPDGGARIDAGLDLSGNETLEEEEITSTSYVCDGEDGDSAHSLVRIDDEPEGENCSAGGKAIHTGLDVNGSGKLEDDEISDTSYICNGQDGRDGADGNGSGPTTHNTMQVRTPDADVNELRCPEEASHTGRKSEYFDIEEGIEGDPLRVCYFEYCRRDIENGRKTESYNYGSQCIQNKSINYNCNNNHEWDGEGCSLTPEACEEDGGFFDDGECKHGCPGNKVVTTRGCEEPIDGCDKDQAIEDNQCKDIDFFELEGDICGRYSDPIRIPSGQRFVTCDATFEEHLLIEAGAILEVDREWDIEANNGIQIKGEYSNPVRIETSPNNPDEDWGSFSVSDAEKQLLRQGHVGGPFVIEHLEVRGQSADVRLENVSARQSSFDVYELSLNNAFLYSSEAKTQRRSSFNSSVVDSSDFDLSDSFYASQSRGSLVTRSAFSAGELNQSQASGFSAASNMHRSVAVFNEGIENTDFTDSPDWPAMYIFGDSEKEKMAGEDLEVSAVVFDQEGFLEQPHVVWRARYDVDGEFFDYGTEWTGLNPTINLSNPEHYEIYVHSINGETDILGSTNIELSVY